jgi:NitT/TauT family transport system ATP-binding protein
MDEPFQALDLKLKLSLLSFFEKLWTEEQRTAIFVTHDIQEALLLGDDIFVFSELPARVKDHMKNTVPHPERTLGHPEILAIERKLYDLLV